MLGLDLLLIIPAGIPPHKALPDGIPEAGQRLTMTITAFAEAPNTVVSDIEINETSPNYTIDTIREIRRDHPDAEFFLLTGTDMFLSLETWRESEVLLNTVTPAVFSRNTGDGDRIKEYSLILKKRYGSNVRVVETEVVEISSSQVRQMLPLRKGAGYIADTNYSYIIKHRLYGAKPDWDWLRGKAHLMLNPARIPHVDGCETEVVKLACRWGVDIDDAREAAILHDITKRLTPEENLELLEAYGACTGQIGFAGEKLLHAKTGALLAKEEFGTSAAVSDAILWHTTGKPCMSGLEKVLYLADYIEPTRTFPGVEMLRELAYTDIDKAMMTGLEMSVSDITARGIIPDRTTIDALEYLKN